MAHVPNTPGAPNARPSWQDQLRGGRTAWSSTVVIQERTIYARYWYDGQYLNNAKEDAAEVALKSMGQPSRSSTVFPSQMWQQPQTTSYGRGTGGL
ncbi:hypothetical protein N7452_009489 [Penicillium brevicompactum]|uniref:Uncharacterized protein n=1 Tax=Penicillium brevicompactum TaxID=5074 RepID=A0A9W9Q8F3_PENBR|nr:hypothetical protein N7452_009489 [Penicillium brevicompactum]